MMKTLKAVLGAGVALVLAKWAYDECVAQYQMHVDKIWCDGYIDHLRKTRGDDDLSPNVEIIASGEADTLKEALEGMMRQAEELGIDPRNAKVVVDKENQEIIGVVASPGA
jgi:hypothetical protein